MKYKIVTGDDRKEIEDKVQVLLDNGWKLQGGVSVSIAFDPEGMKDGGGTIFHESYAQAVIKEEE